jgi:hypothetical protein
LSYEELKIIPKELDETPTPYAMACLQVYCQNVDSYRKPVIEK